LTATSDDAGVKIELSLTSDTYRRSSPDLTDLVVTVTITNVDVLTVEIRGEKDNGTILENGFRVEHFTFHDLATGDEVINKNPFPGTCDPGDSLAPYDTVELQSSSSPFVTRHGLEDMDPLCDPVRQLKNGHAYRVTLKPQTVWCFAGSKKQLFGDQRYIPIEDLPKGTMVRLESSDELTLKVEA
jgi:hypothetical protein